MRSTPQKKSEIEMKRLTSIVVEYNFLNNRHFLPQMGRFCDAHFHEIYGTGSARSTIGPGRSKHRNFYASLRIMQAGHAGALFLLQNGWRQSVRRLAMLIHKFHVVLLVLAACQGQECPLAVALLDLVIRAS